MTSKSCPVTSTCTLWHVFLVGLTVAEIPVFGSRATVEGGDIPPTHTDPFVSGVCGKYLVCDSTQPIYQKIKMGRGKVDRCVNLGSLLGEAAPKSCPLSSSLYLAPCGINSLIKIIEHTAQA